MMKYRLNLTLFFFSPCHAVVLCSRQEKVVQELTIGSEFGGLTVLQEHLQLKV